MNAQESDQRDNTIKYSRNHFAEDQEENNDQLVRPYFLINFYDVLTFI